MSKCDAMMRFRLPKETKEVLRRIADERTRAWQKRVTMSDVARERLIDSVLTQPHDKPGQRPITASDVAREALELAAGQLETNGRKAA